MYGAEHIPKGHKRKHLKECGKMAGRLQSTAHIIETF
jgi:hypothetical protein